MQLLQTRLNLDNGINNKLHLGQIRENRYLVIIFTPRYSDYPCSRSTIKLTFIAERNFEVISFKFFMAFYTDSFIFI